MSLRSDAPPRGPSVVPDDAPDSSRVPLPRETRRSYFGRRAAKLKGAALGYVVSGGIQLRLDDGSVLGTVIRLNARSVWFEPVPQVVTPYGRTIPIRITSDQVTLGPFSAKIGIEPVEDELYAVAHMDDLPLASGREVIGFMLDATERGLAAPPPPKGSTYAEIDDPVRLRVVASALARRHAEGTVYVGDQALQARIVDFDENVNLIMWKLADEAEAGSVPGQLRIEVPGYNCIYQLTFDAAERMGELVCTRLPTKAKYVRHRRYRRTTVSTSAFATFQHPIWQELGPFMCPLLDVSFGGIAFATDPQRDALYVGLRIEGIEVAYGRNQVVLLDAVVRTISRAPDGSATCGLSVEGRTSQDASNWADFVMRSLNQTTSPGDDKVEQLWDLFTVSGYFNLSGKGPEEFNSLARAFRNVVEQSRAIPWLTYQSVWPSEAGIEASISVLKLYNGTWLMHQVAKRRGASHRDGQVRQVLRDTYLRAYEYAHADPHCRWVASYVEAQVPWTQRSHLAFARQFGLTNGVVSWPFQLMEIYCHDRPEHKPLGLFRVGLATEEECEILCDVLHETRPEAYVEALDLVPERLGLFEAKRAWQAAGFDREREILVARRLDHTPVAVAIVETGETGTNLFRIVDSLRLVALAPDGEQAFLELIEKARAWFRTRGKESFVYFSECEEGPRAQLAMERDLGPGRMWAVRCELIPDFLEFVCELSEQRLGVKAENAVKVMP
jgi:hypothetical protein